MKISQNVIKIVVDFWEKGTIITFVKKYLPKNRLELEQGVRRLGGEGTLENPTTEWVPKVQSGVFPRQSLRQKYGDEIRPISVGRGFFSILFFRALSGDGAFLSPIFKERKECRTSSTS